MGFIPEPTPEMGEYSVEVCSESFYLSGADPHEAVYEQADRPAHSLVVYVQRRPIDEASLPGRPLSDKDRERVLHVIATARPDTSMYRAAVADLIGDADHHRALAKAERASVTTYGMVEFYTADIPNLRACLDTVERVIVDQGGHP